MPGHPARLCLLAILLALPGAAAGKAKPFDGCLRTLTETRVETISCVADYALPAGLREQLAGLTGGAVRDAACRMRVKVQRKTLFEAMLADERVQLPAQPVACDLATSQQPLQATFTVAPSVWFADGRAVRASPGMADIAGLPPSVGRLLQRWVNESPLIQTAMVNAVNRFLDRQLGR
jgi:hypothetical protein